MNLHETTSINAVLIWAEAGEESMPEALLPRRSNKSSLGAWSGWDAEMKTWDKWMWGINIIQWGEQEQKADMEAISLCLKEIFSSFREHFSSPIPPGLVTAESFILFTFSVMQLPSHQQTYINGREQNESQDWKNKAPSSQVPWYSMWEGSFLLALQRISNCF